MQRVRRDHRFRNHGDLSTVPETPPLRVALDESFIVETVDTADRFIMSEADLGKPPGPMAGNPSTGPIFVEGIEADDVIAVHIEQLNVVGHCSLGIQEKALLPSDVTVPREDFVRIAEGLAHFPGDLRAPLRPMFGCLGVVPAQPSPEPWHHGGNLDIPDVCAGNIFHVRCQRDGAFLACGDGHAVQGDGEIAGFSLEVSLEGILRVRRSPYQKLRTILIESPAEFITVGVEHELHDSVKSAVHSMSELLAHEREIGLLDAYQLAVHVGDLRLGAMWPMWSEWQIPIPACLHLSKQYFR